MEHPPTFQNEHVRFTLHRKPRCIVEFDVEVLEPLARETRKEAIKMVTKGVVVPGFRKGRAPAELIAKNYPKEIDKEWQQVLANRVFAECQKLAQLPLLRQEGARNTYAMKEYSPTGALLTVEAEVEPTIPEVDPARLQLKPIKRPEVNEAKVEETIRQTQMFFAHWTPVTDRPVHAHDFVLLDVDVIEEDPPTPLFSRTRFEVTEKGMAKWMYDLVFGKSLGESVEGVSVPDADASAEDQAALTPKKVRVTIVNIETAILPELDETFVQGLGVSSMEELRTNITALLNKQADEHVQEAEREQAAEFLLNDNPFDLPQSLIDKEARFRFEQLGNHPEFMNYWQNLGTEQRQNTAKTILEHAEKAVRMFYLCKEIITRAHIKISAEDIPPPAATTLELLLNPQKLFHHQRTSEAQHAEAYSRLILEKAEDHILKHATRPALAD